VHDDRAVALPLSVKPFDQGGKRVVGFREPVIGDREPVKFQPEVAAEIRLVGQAVDHLLPVAEQRHHDFRTLILPRGEIFAEPLVGHRLRRRGETAHRSTTDPERWGGHAIPRLSPTRRPAP
jgi:hypothetical protein